MSMETNRPGTHGSQGEGYERRDADVRALLQFGFWLAVLLLAILFSMKWTYEFFSKVEPTGPPATPVMSENGRVLPPSPRLQVKARADLQKYRDAQQDELTTYGWTDQHNGVVRIPIDRAMDLIIQRGLPARSSGDAVGSGSVAPAKSTQGEAPSEATRLTGATQARGGSQ
jgi:hypothetical protein